MRRVGERRTGLFRRLRPVYEVVVVEDGTEVFAGSTVTPSSVLASRGRVHTTDTWDWVQAADRAHARQPGSWISDPFRDDAAG